MSFDPETSKLIATLLVSLLGSFLGAFLGDQKEKREAHRKLLQEDIKEIGSTAYQSVAIARTMLSRIKKGKSRADWLARHRNNRVCLEKVRIAVGYSEVDPKIWTDVIASY